MARIYKSTIHIALRQAKRKNGNPIQDQYIITLYNDDNNKIMDLMDGAKYDYEQGMRQVIRLADLHDHPYTQGVRD